MHPALSCRHQEVYTKLVVTCVHPAVAMSVCVCVWASQPNFIGPLILRMPRKLLILPLKTSCLSMLSAKAPRLKGESMLGSPHKYVTDQTPGWCPITSTIHQTILGMPQHTLFYVQCQFRGRPTPKPPAPPFRGQFQGPPTSKLTSKPPTPEVSGSVSGSK